MGVLVVSLLLGLLVVISCNLPEIRYTLAYRTPRPYVGTVFYLVTAAAGYAVMLSLFTLVLLEAMISMAQILR